VNPRQQFLVISHNEKPFAAMNVKKGRKY